MKNLIATLAFVLWLIPLVSAEAQHAYRNQAGHRASKSVRPGSGSFGGRPNPVRPAARRMVTQNRSILTSRPQGEVVQGEVVQGEVIEGEILPEDSYIEGEYIEDGGYVVEGDYYGDTAIGCDGCGGGGCDACSIGHNFCDGCHAPHRFCICFPSHGWIHAEYLQWYQKGIDLPPLVTSSPDGTARADAGVLPDASTLFGGNDVLGSDRSGLRIRFGVWLNNLPGWGLSGEFTGLPEETETFFLQSTGSPIVARPFFNVLNGAEDAELVAFPSVVTGSIRADVTSQFEGAAFRVRRQLCGKTGCGYSEICCQPVPTSSRFDMTIGYRFWELDESLTIHEELQQTEPNATGSFDITDSFATRNTFNGWEIGMLWQARRGWWSADALMRLGIGNMHQTVTIAGNSTITENGVTNMFDTGFLTQRTNVGTYDRDVFTMVPELGLNLGYQFTKRLRGTIGYSLIYIGNVVRPGDQVDLDVNPNLLAPELDPFSGPLRPQFAFQETDYWVQGLSFGGECRW